MKTVRFASLRLACALAALSLPAAAFAQDGEGGREGEETSARQRAEVVPYIEAAQIFTAELEPGSDTVTYTALAAGVDASVVGRNSAASVSLRYERRIGYDDNSVEGDTVSGVARAGLERHAARDRRPHQRRKQRRHLARRFRRR